MDKIRIGEIITIPRDQNGKPVLKYDRKQGKYSLDELQKFRVISITENGIGLSAVWDE